MYNISHPLNYGRAAESGSRTIEIAGILDYLDEQTKKKQ